MATLQPEPATQTRRSRSGCTACRQRHRKCDEQKPACSRCQQSGRECVYSVRLSWGGRPFSKSRFGKCFLNDPGLVQVPVCSSVSGSPAFIYRSSAGRKPSPPPVAAGLKDSENSSQNEQNDGVVLNAPTTSNSLQLPVARQVYSYRDVSSNSYQIFRNPDELQWLSRSHRLLLEHFTSCTTLALSCHPVIQHSFCSILIPMAFQTSHLFVALLSLAATHRLSLGLYQDPAELDFLRCTSLRQLQTILSQPGRQLDEAVIATTLTLCTSDIAADARTPGSWRSHLKGAATIISEHLQDVRNNSDSLTITKSLLWRWYLSIETASSLSGNLLLSPGSSAPAQLKRFVNDDEIDDVSAISLSLLPILNDVNRLVVETSFLRQAQEMGTENPISVDDPRQTPNDSIMMQCYKLIDQLQSKLESHEPKFRPPINASLSHLHKLDYSAVDQAYHHVALLQLYRRVLNLPSSDVSVQFSVQRIIKLISNVHFLREPCPGVAILTPLFTAGCEASMGPDRDDIRALFALFETCYGLGNAKSVRQFLEDLWVMRDENGDLEGKVRWDRVMVERGLDILPY